MVIRAKIQHIFFPFLIFQSFNMSSINVNSILSSISSMEKELASLRALLGSAPSKTAAPAEKKQRKKRVGPPSAWVLFSDRVRDILRTNGYEKSDLGIHCVQFCSSLKDENKELSSWTDADILARRAAWSVPAESKQAAAGIHYVKGKKVVTPPGSTTGSVVSVSDGDAPVTEPAKKQRKNPWAGLTDEQRLAKSAAMQAGKAAKKAATTTSSTAETNVAASAVVADTSAVVADTKSDGGSSAKKRKPWSDETKAAAKAKRDAKKNAATSSTTTTTEATTLPPLPTSPPESVVTSEFKGLMLGGARYLVDMSTGHCYHRSADGSQGDWAGLFHRTGGPKGGSWIDDSVAEPENDSDSGSDSGSDSE